MSAELWLNLVQFLVGIQGQFQLQPALRPLYCHPVFVTEFHAARVSGGRGRLKEKFKLPTVTWRQPLTTPLVRGLLWPFPGCRPCSQSLLFSQALAGQLHRFFRLAIEDKVSNVLRQRLRGGLAQAR